MPGDQSHESVVAHRRIAQSFSGWRHDDGWWVGECSGKEDVPYVLNASEHTYFDDCSAGHRGTAMSLITNHEAGNGSLEAWQRWWEANKNKTQAEWMLEGFKAEGIEIKLPLDHSTYLRLLKLMGRDVRSRENRFLSNATSTKTPGYIVTNLHRLLSSHWPDVRKVTKEEIAADETDDLLLGLISTLQRSRYDRFFHDPYVEPQQHRSEAKIRGILNPWVPWKHWAGSFAVFQAGFILVMRSRYRKTRSDVSHSPLHS